MNAVSVLMQLFSFPLLAKELTEAAARRRTYVMRVIYGVLLFLMIAVWMPRAVWSEDDYSMQMGLGSDIFKNILWLQFIGLVLFLPALMCGTITHEKERDSLVLLLLTELRPWSIVLQKYIGALVPVLSFLLLAMPCMAIAYAFGGVSLADILWSSVALLLTALQIGALSLMLSVWCRTTVGAFIATYFWTLALYVGPELLFELLPRAGGAGGIDGRTPYILLPAAIVGDAHVGSSYGSFTIDTEYLTHKICAIALSIMVFLTVGRFFLVRRAFLPASSIFLRLFRILDRSMKWANRFVGNFVLIRDSVNLPEDEPVAWREITRRALGKTVYLFRILMAVEIPVILICWAAAFTSVQRERCNGLSVLAAVVGAFGVLALGAQAANTIVSERIQQTLEVLLTTPLGAAEIVKQKAKALRRVMLILAIPLVTIFGTKCWIEHGFSTEWGDGLLLNDHAIMYGGCCALALSIFLPLACWLALWIGLKVRTRFKAIVAALAVIVAWCALPFVAISCIQSRYPASFMEYASIKAIELLSPLSIVAANEHGEVSALAPVTTLIREIASQDFAGQLSWGQPGPAPSAWPIVTVTFVFYGFLLWLIRRQALRNADFYLRR